jgi:ABC-type nitrate/sulfonate/bicarbonate transport system substrate-binding protein
MTSFEKAQPADLAAVRRAKLERTPEATQALADAIQKLLAEVREWRKWRG